MTDLAKNVLGGTRSLVIGWILPLLLTLQLITTVVFPELRANDTIAQFLGLDLAQRQAAMLATAAVLGIVLAAARTPLYRVLEGHTLWPRKLVEYRIAAHRKRRQQLAKDQECATLTGHGVRAGILYERLARYPVNDGQFAPTTLGNAIRGFETYAGDRYQLDSQLLWHDLNAAAPDRVVTAVENARTNADFFVCLLYGGIVSGILGVAVAIFVGPTANAYVAVLSGVLLPAVSYRMAVLATDEWGAAVRALVNHSRGPVAKSFGLTIPADLAEERLMWRAINTLVRRPYSYSEARDVAEILERFREQDGVGPLHTTAVHPRHG